MTKQDIIRQQKARSNAFIAQEKAKFLREQEIRKIQQKKVKPKSRINFDKLL